jgi:hypothetical protein
LAGTRFMPCTASHRADAAGRDDRLVSKHPR